MPKQTMTVPLSRDLLKPADFKVDANGNLTIDKQKLNQIVKDNIDKTPPKEMAAVSVGVVVEF